MPSPFPGMNPYLEQSPIWRDFHTSFLVTLRSVLVPLVRPKYHIELEEAFGTDPTETEPSASKEKMRRLVARDSRSQEVVTAIELLSPSNKAAGADRDKYLEKRVGVLTSAANFVELDLIRGGQRMPIRPRPECDYYVLVSRAWQRPEMGRWPLRLREPLPAVPIPLRSGEPEPLIELKAVLDRTYDEAGYEDRIYHTPPDPPLTAADAGWAKVFVPAPAAP